mmetsp:Transcript_111152/g.309003  ORF Transcript_111152/g.309003 Transcript_111152/m.309003 type:complete len:134 (+) Transcript_111152:174-575(+)
MSDFDVDRPAVIKHFEPTYHMRPVSEDVRFRPSQVRKACEEVLASVLDGKVWKGEEETIWSVEIAEEIKRRVKAMDIPRYKVVVQVTIGEMKQQGVRVASRCLWDTDSDNYASFSYKNESLWCVAMVFGCYTE